MPLYEHVFLARQDLSTAQVDALSAHLTSVIEAGAGKVTKTEYWGLKTLAYRIKKNRKAHFVLLNIEAPPAALFEMERQVGLSEDIIRSLTLRVETHEEGPSAMMRKSDRSERDTPREGGREGGRDGLRGDRPERAERSERSERPDRGDRPERGGDRPPRAPRF